MKSKFYYDDFMLKDHTTVKLVWTVPKEYGGARNEGGRMEIMRGFIKSDLVIQINNAWGNLKSITDSFLTGSTGSGASEILNGMGDLLLKGNEILSGAINSTGSQTLSDLEKLANSKSFSFSDYIKRYQGTDMAFPNNIDVVFIADEEGKDPRIEARRLLKFIVGGLEVYNKTNQEEALNKSDKKGEWMEFIKSIGNAGKEFFEKTNGILVPPGGYRYSTSHDYRNPNKFITGTLSLVIGRSKEIRNSTEGTVKYSDLVLRNLLVDSAEMVVSKTLTTSGYPLYVTVAIGLSPSSFYSAGNLHVLLGGNGEWDNFDIEDIPTILDNDVQEDADREYHNRYPGRPLPNEKTLEQQQAEDVERQILLYGSASVNAFRRKYQGRDSQVFLGKDGELYTIGMSSATIASNPEAFNIYKDQYGHPLLMRGELVQFNNPNSELARKFKVYIDDDNILREDLKKMKVGGKPIWKEGDKELSNTEIMSKYCKATAEYARENEVSINYMNGILQETRTQNKNSVNKDEKR